MKISAVRIQEWCNTNITPMAWQRVAMKTLPFFRDKGLSISELNDPQGIILDEESIQVLSQALRELYQIELPVYELA